MVAARCVGLTGSQKLGARVLSGECGAGKCQRGGYLPGAQRIRNVAAARPLLFLLFPKLQERGILAGNLTRILLNTSEALGRSTGESLETGLSLLPTTQAESSVHWESSWPSE